MSFAVSSPSTRVTRDQLASIPCPNLRTLVNEGYLTPDESGIVDLAQLDVALQRIGVKGLPLKALVGVAEKATHEAVAQQLGAAAAGKFNVFKLQGSIADHVGDTRILRPGFDAARLDWLLSFATNGRVGLAELAAAQKEARNDEPSKFADKATGVAEMTALVRVYGTRDANGNRSISVEGVRSLYEKAKFPEEWKISLIPDAKLGAVNPEKMGLMSLISGMVEMAFRQLGTSSGRAHLGMDLALNRDPQVSQTAAYGIGNSICPAGPPSAMPKAQADDAHVAAAGHSDSTGA